MKKFTQLRTLLTMLLMLFGVSMWANEVEISKFNATSSSLNDYVSYAASKGKSATVPAVYTEQIRIYQNGGLFTVNAENGATITDIVLKSAMATTVTYAVDGGAVSENVSMSKDANVEFTGLSATDKVVFTCMGTDKNSRLYVSYLKVTYTLPNASDPVAVESVALTDANGSYLGDYINLTQFESTQIKAVVSPAEATNKKVEWEVMGEDGIISFDNGAISALKPGTVAVVATTEDGEKQAMVYVYVNEPVNKSIASFIESKGASCYLTGIVSDIQNDTYGNYTLTDASGSIYVYGTLTPEGETKKFASLGIKEGDEIVVRALEYKLFNTTDEAVNVVFVENHGVPAPPVSCTFDVKVTKEGITVTPSDENVQYLVDLVPNFYTVDDLNEAYDEYYAPMGAGLDFVSGVQTILFDDWGYSYDELIEEEAAFAIWAVNDNYARVGDATLVDLTLTPADEPVEVALSNIQIMEMIHPQLGAPVSWWEALDEEGNAYTLIFDEDYNLLQAAIVLSTDEELYSDDEFENNVIVNKTANGISLDATIKFTDYDEIEQVYHITANIATAAMSISDALYATFVAPFNVEIPEGVKAYTVDAVENNVLTMTEVTTTIPANTPVVLEGEDPILPVTFTGTAVEGTPKAGLLTGVFEETAAPAGSYVLQNLDNVIGFYKVNSDITVPANRAYLTVDSSVKAFYFGEATAIEALQSLMAGKAEIYDMNGRKLQSLQKGMNIVNGKKVMVK